MNVDGIQNVDFCFRALQTIPKAPKHGPAGLALLVMGVRREHKGVFNLQLISASPALSICNVIESSG